MTDPIAYLDGQPYPIRPGESIYDFVTRQRGADAIPVLCHDPVLEPFGACRLCSVEVAAAADGPRRVVAACHTPVGEGQHIHPDSPRIERLRRSILELLLTDYPPERLTPLPGERPTPFQAALARYRPAADRYPHAAAATDLDHSHPYLRFDGAECIRCYRCIRACDEVQGRFVLAMHGRGADNRVVRGLDRDFAASACVACGRCVQTCPTNALSDRYRAKTVAAERRVRTVCTYCGVGCNLEVLVQGGAVAAVAAAEDAPVNRGHTCVKGRYAFEYHRHPERLRTPLIRRDGELRPATWDEALDHIATRLAAIRAAHGPDAIAGISSARCTNEENYLMQKFLRVVIGSNNIDGCARVCHAPTAYGMQQTFGTGAATNSIAEIDLADCLLVIGANPTEAHPVTGARLKQRALKGVPLIVVDPRRSELAALATLHLQLRPGSNVALLTLMAHYIVAEGWVNEPFVAARTEGFEEFRAAVLALDPAELERVTGVPREQVCAAARLYATAERAMEFHGLGVTEHWQGSRTVMLIAALALLTGQVGRPGTGVNPLRGQNNVQGAADMGVQPNLGAGYLDVTDPAVRAHYRRHYGREVPGQPGWKIPEMFRAARAGRLKALWVVGEDLLQTDPNTCEVESSLRGLELLVVQELFLTRTAAQADVVLPAASHFEKSGTFTNGERRVQRVNAAIDPLPGTRPDGQIMVDIMNRMGYPQAGYDPALHLQEIAQVVPFFAGITWAGLGDHGKQWPVAADGSDSPILHRESFPTGRARLRFHAWTMSPELREGAQDYPFVLTTGRLLEHYNCGSMTRRTPNAELVDRDLLHIHPSDAAAYGIRDGERVTVTSRQGTTHVDAHITDEVQPGVLFTTFHFPEIAINQITGSVADEFTLTPEFKVVRVGIGKG